MGIQINSLQIEYDNLNARYEEEVEGAGGMRNQVSKLQAELVALRSKYDKDMMMKAEELEDLRRRLNARIAELEDACEQARTRAAKMEKEKTKLSIEIREITVELESATMAAQ